LCLHDTGWSQVKSSWRGGCGVFTHFKPMSRTSTTFYGLDGVLKDWLDGLHDVEAALHVVDLGLLVLDGLHLVV
jgi:hypothetical protein